MQIVHAYEDFYASHNHKPGSRHDLRVSGTVVFATGGWSCDLRPAEGNTGINPQLLVLDLVLTPPSAGTAVPEVLTPCRVEWSVTDPEIEYTQAEFRVVGSDDDPPPVLEIEHPE